MRVASLPILLVIAAIALAGPAAGPGGPASAAGGSVVAIGVGDRHSCAVGSTGGVVCWGYNATAQIGDGTSGTSRTVPVAVSGLSSGVAAVAGGFEHTCARMAAGTVKCWGDSFSGQVGDGTIGTVRLTPVDVGGLSGVSALAAGGLHTCALTNAGGVKCWGDNFFGQLGDGLSGNRRGTVADVPGLTSGVVAIAAGGYHTCALLSGGGVKCWGRNDAGQVGDGTSGEHRPSPVDVTLPGGAASIAAGSFHTCAVTPSGGAKCWGRNSAGQIGDGGLSNRTAPVDVSGLTSGVLAVVPGGFHTCALLTGGGVKCWGRNGSGQVGSGTTGTQESLPLDVTGLGSGVTALSTGGDHACVLLSSGTTMCWGLNTDGQVGDGNAGTMNSTPVDVVGLSGDIDGDGIPNASDPDDDNDGCPDARELGPNVTTGGGRSPKNFWDFYDTPDATNFRDRTITVIDVFRIVTRFGTVGSPTIDPLTPPPASGYHTAFDRNIVPSQLSGPPDGRVTIADLALSVGQFGHSCV